MLVGSAVTAMGNLEDQYEESKSKRKTEENVSCDQMIGAQSPVVTSGG